MGLSGMERQELLEHINSVRTFNRYSGVRVTRLEDQYCEGEMEVGPDHLNPLGAVHGGCLVTLADTVSGVAASSRGRQVVTLNDTFNFLRPATGPRIRCAARVEREGRTITVVRCSLTDERGEQVASGEFTFYQVGDVARGILAR